MALKQVEIRDQMNAEATQEDLEPIGEAEYKTLEQTLMESDRGRRFLKEFLHRNKTPETTEILEAIQRLEKVVTRHHTVPDLDKIRLDIADMHEAIERTKSEIANIKSEEDDSNRFIDASHELDAIVSQTEGATQSILEAAEMIQEKAWILRENGADDETCDDIDAKATEIFMACSFQDLTGQRTNKVVQVLRYLESRINMMINIWGIDELEADATAGPVDTRPDAHLLNGPQTKSGGVNQNDVDDLMSGGEIEFDSIDVSEPDTSASTETAADEPMDASAIDDMFASAPAAAEEAAEELEGLDADATLDEAAIEQLFDNEVNAAAEESEADADWEQVNAESTADEGSDPLTDLSEAERQALFN